MIINKHSLADSTKSILEAATALAGKHRLQFTGTEHVLMALCADPEFVSFISSKVNFDPDIIHFQIEQCIALGEETSGGNALRYTIRLTEVLNMAAAIGKREFGCHQIEPHHLLLGILLEGHSVTAYVLKKHSITYELTLNRCKDVLVQQNLVGMDSFMSANAS